MIKLRFFYSSEKLAEARMNYVSMAFPCFVTICKGMKYIRIECRKEDAIRIKNIMGVC